MAQSKSNLSNGFRRGSLSQMVGGVNPTPAAKQMGSQYQINRATGLMERKPAPVQWGVPTQGTIPAPSFGTKTTTPAVGNVPRNVVGSSGLSTSAPATTQTAPANISPSTPQTGRTSAPVSNTSQQQLDSIRSQAVGIQDMLNQRIAAENAAKANTSTTSNSNTPNTTGDSSNTFPGILNDLLGRSNVQREQERTRKLLERTALENKAIADNARLYSEQYGKEIAEVGRLGAGAVAGSLSTGTQAVGSGNANLASMSASARMSALSDAQQAALKGTEQQLTAQEQTAQALRPSLDATLTQQQLGLSGLGTAANLAAPAVAPYGQTVFNPLQPGFAGGNMDPQTQANSVAQQLISGQMTYEQAVEAMQYAGTAGTNFLNQALTSMGANPLQLQAQGLASQTNLQTTGTATTGIARVGLEETTRNYNQLLGAAQAAHNQSNNVVTILDKTGLNNISSTDYNKALNSIQRRFSDTDFAALQTALNEAQIMYTNLLSTGGGTPSGNELNAITALNINQSAAAIKSSIQQLETAASFRLQALDSIRTQYQSNLNTGGGMTGATGGGGNTFAEQW
jgi:hypothetical protein